MRTPAEAATREQQLTKFENLTFPIKRQDIEAYCKGAAGRGWIVRNLYLSFHIDADIRRAIFFLHPLTQASRPYSKGFDNFVKQKETIRDIINP